MDKRSRWGTSSAFDESPEIRRMPGPSLETLWIPAGWGKSLVRSQSTFDLKQQPRQLRSVASQMITKQVTPKQSLRSIQSYSAIARDPIGLFILEIPHWVNIEAIIAVFARFGSIVNVSIDKKEMFALVDYESSISVKSAIQELNGKVYFGGPLILRERYGKGSCTTDEDVTATGNEDFDMCTLYITSLPHHIKKVIMKLLKLKCDLKEGFEHFGIIKRIHLGNKGQDKNFAMITFQEEKSASLAMVFSKSNNMFGLSQIKVDYARKMKLSRAVSRLKNKPSTADFSGDAFKGVNQITKSLAELKA